MTENATQQTLVLIKPDAMKNSLTGFILSQLSEFHTGLRFAGLKVVRVSRMLAEEHYAEHRGKVFFPSLLEYITGRLHHPRHPENRRIIAIVYEGPDAIRKIRDLAGPTNPHVARDEKPGCIRSMGTVVPLKDDSGRVVGERMDNLIHASAKPDEAEKEIKLWFRPEDIPPAMHAWATAESDNYYYFKEGRLLLTQEQGGFCFLVPGAAVWKTDLDALQAMARGEEAAVSLESIVAKYLINDAHGRDD